MTGNRTTQLAAGLALLAIGCGSEADPARAPELDAPVAPRATLLLAPSVLHIGEIVTAEIAVVTPPENRLRAHSGCSSPPSTCA